MRVLVVVDSIVDIKKKVEKFSNKFGDNLNFVVSNELVDIFKTYGYPVHAIYTRECSNVIHLLLGRLTIDDTIIYYTSLDVEDGLINKFSQTIAAKDCVVSLNPQYNFFERTFNKLYNVYVRKLAKCDDTLYSKKLQFIPKSVMEDLIDSHVANRLFVNSDYKSKDITTNDKTENKNWKKSEKNFKPLVINAIAALMITIMFLMSIILFGAKYVVVLIFIMLYALDLVISFMYAFKLKFDQRFLR